MKKDALLGVYKSKGRLIKEANSKYRSPFQRDRDRIIHSASFRRLKHKTQVFVNTEGDHFRTRITHSIEVAQIARSIAKYLKLNEDLAETLSLAHDLGHTPFGHAGEDALHECMDNYGGFDHNLQTLRIVMFLENKYLKFKGLNLTIETLEGLLKHNGPVNELTTINKLIGSKVFKNKIKFNSFPSLEAQISAISDDIALMNEAGINTIRVYEPILDKNVLDILASNNIKVIVSLGFNQSGLYDINSGTYEVYINEFKDHPAILMWELGNEYNYHPEWFGGKISNWYKAANKAAKRIKEIDPNHPVSTAHGDLPDKQARRLLDSIDAWGFNVYRWDKPMSIAEEWAQVSDKPFYFSEAGADSFMTQEFEDLKAGPNQEAQARANAIIIDEIFSDSNNNLGILLFSMVDGLWKAGNPSKQDPGGAAPFSTGVPYDGAANEEYWGIVDIERNKKISFNVVKDKYQNFRFSEED